MTIRTLVLLVALLVPVIAGTPLGAWPRAADRAQVSSAQAPQPTSAVLLGQVIDADTGDPVSDAVVTLLGRPAPAAARGRRGGAPPAGGNIFDIISVGRGRGSSEQVAADSEGRFVFRDLPASRYTVRAEAPGYLSAAGGLTGRNGGPAQFEVEAGETTARVAVRLWKEAVLTGLVLDEASEPIIRARVTAYRLNISPLGEVAYDSSANALTDDRGQYRMFGLQPGIYLVAVPQSHGTAEAAGADAMLQGLMSGQMPEGGLGGLAAGNSPMDPDAVRIGEWRLNSTNVQAPPATGNALLRAYRTVYFPAALFPAGAAPVTLGSGEERPGIDFVLSPVVTGRITGTVMGASGPVGGVPIRAVAVGDATPGATVLSNVASGQTTADGRFTLLAVPPGQYRVIAEREARDLGNLPEELASNPMIKMALEMRGSATPLYGETVVSLGDGETVDVTVAGSEGVTVTGQLLFDGTTPTPADIARMRVSLRAIGRSASGSRLVRLDKDGRFVAESVLPGRYTVAANAGGSEGPWLVREVTAGGRSATRSPVIVETEALTMTVTLTSRVGSVRGTVRRDSVPGRASSAAPASSPLTAIVVPADYMTWTDLEMASSWVRLSPVAGDDTFRAGPLVAGEYLVAVVDEAGIDLTRGVAALQAIAAQATRVIVTDGEAMVTVTVAGGRR